MLSPEVGKLIAYIRPFIFYDLGVKAVDIDVKGKEKFPPVEVEQREILRRSIGIEDNQLVLDCW